jgi:hypothetical protein
MISISRYPDDIEDDVVALINFVRSSPLKVIAVRDGEEAVEVYFEGDEEELD